MVLAPGQAHRHNPERSLALIKALTKTGDARAVPHFIADMKNEYMQYHWNKNSAETIVEVISKFGLEAVNSLIKELHNPSLHLAELAAKALVKIGQPAVPALVNELKAGLGFTVRKVFIKTLEELGWQPQTIDEKMPVWLNSGDYGELVKPGPHGAAALLLELKVGYCDEWRRVSIIEALGAIGERSAVPALMQILQERGGCWERSVTNLPCLP